MVTITIEWDNHDHDHQYMKRPRVIWNNYHQIFQDILIEDRKQFIGKHL